jgi:hypothetical protein
MPPWAIPATISKAWACPGTSTFVHRSDDRTTTARAGLMAPRRCIVVWPAHLASQRIRVSQSRRPKRLMAVCSLAQRETALSLQAAYSDYEIGAFENFHQLVEDTLMVLRLAPKVFFQYELHFVNCLKSQLLISHLLLPIKQGRCSTKEREIKSLLGNILRSFELFDQFLFHCRGGFRFNPRITNGLCRRGHLWLSAERRAGSQA